MLREFNNIVLSHLIKCRIFFLFSGIIFLLPGIYAQPCTTTNGSGCKCPDSTSVNCDLLPDMTISRQMLMDPGGYDEYPQKKSEFGINDGKLRLSVMTPNIGMGPLEIHATKFLICGTDTFSTGYAGKCPDGLEPKHIVTQRIYHKIADSITYYDHSLGAMPYVTLSSSSHIGRFEYLSLRLKDPKESDPRKWPLVAGSNKNSFCLEDDMNCSAYPGICRNLKDSIIYDSDLPNFAMGGYYNCAMAVQGISPGYTDTYDKNLYGMWIDIPPGTCNGNDYYLVVEIDPDNHFLESDKDNNVVTVPVNLTKQDSAGNPTAIIYPQGPTTICFGDSLKLLATAAYSYKWSTGDTTSSIIVSAAGNYAVTVTSPCGTATSAPLTVNMLGPPPLPVLTGDTICLGDSARLKAVGSDSLVWYDKSSGGKVVATGNSYITPPLANSTSYFVENVKTIAGLSAHVGKPDTSGAGKYYKNLSYMAFDCISPFTLEAVTVYAKKSGTLTMALVDWSGYALNTKQVSLTAGKNRVLLGFPVIPEYNYQLQIRSDTAHPFYGNTDNFSFPYTMPGVISIKASGLGKSDYTCLYDWEIKTTPFHPASARVPVTGFVDKSCILGARRLDMTMPDFAVSPNPFTDRLSVKIEGAAGSTYIFIIYDVTGRIVKTENISSAGTSVINRGDLLNGIYFYKIFSDKTILVAGKIIAE